MEIDMREVLSKIDKKVKVSILGKTVMNISEDLLQIIVRVKEK
jgi:hypothetical protein